MKPKYFRMKTGIVKNAQKCFFESTNQLAKNDQFI